MEFATLDKMIMELEKEKEIYVKDMDNRISDIKACIEKMKADYRKETMPEVNGMVEYLLERAKKRLGDAVIEASDISEKVMEDFYEATERKVNLKRIVLGYKIVDDLEAFGESWFFFTDKELYVWCYDRLIRGYSIYPYKAIKNVQYDKKTAVDIRTPLLRTPTFEYMTNTEIKVDVDENVDVKIDNYVTLRYLLVKAGDNAEAIVRLILDLRDFANQN